MSAREDATRGDDAHRTRHQDGSSGSDAPAATSEYDASAQPSPGDEELVAALRRGDEQAFTQLVTALHRPMLRVALMYVANRAVAEDVIQQTWLGVLRGLDRFEGRSALRTWIFRILVNIAKTRGKAESRSVPFSALAETEVAQDEPAVPPERFLLDERDPSKGYWASTPRDWSTLPEERLLSAEARATIAQAIAVLPPAQREVITLRDVDGCSAEEVCEALAISAGNQRVLLHRARAKVRRTLDHYLGAE
ncbi:MAG TPA: sigma-70 family RNA polymerase sigma factor [Ktedonobacterales bacterium]